MSDGASLLQKPVFGLIPDLEKRQSPILIELVAETGIIEPVHEIFDVERGEAKRHGGEHCPDATSKTSPQQPEPASFVAVNPRSAAHPFAEAREEVILSSAHGRKMKPLSPPSMLLHLAAIAMAACLVLPASAHADSPSLAHNVSCDPLENCLIGQSGPSRPHGWSSPR